MRGGGTVTEMFNFSLLWWLIVSTVFQKFMDSANKLMVMTLLLPLKTKLIFERSYEQRVFQEISFAHKLHRMQAVAYHSACPHRSMSLVNDRMNSKQKKKKTKTDQLKRNGRNCKNVDILLFWCNTLPSPPPRPQPFIIDSRHKRAVLSDPTQMQSVPGHFY